jgi:methyl-accepting chemotaxis protein PixJ
MTLTYPVAQPDEDLFNAFDANGAEDTALVSSSPKSRVSTGGSHSSPKSDSNRAYAYSPTSNALSAKDSSADLDWFDDFRDPDELSLETTTSTSMRTESQAIPMALESDTKSGSPDAQQFNKAMAALKRHLEQAGCMKRTGIRQQLQQITQLFHNSHEGIEDLIDVGVQQQLQTLAQQRSVIAQALNGTSNNKAALETAAKFLQRTIGADRILIIQFIDETKTQILVDTASRAQTLQGKHLPADCFGLSSASAYAQNVMTVSNYNTSTNTAAAHSDRQNRFFERIQMSTCLATTVMTEGAWGLVIALKADESTPWQAFDMGIASAVATELQAKLNGTKTNQGSSKTASRNDILAKTNDFIRKGVEPDRIYPVIVQDMRRLLQADRVAIFQFEEGSNCTRGSVTVEDVAPEYVSALQVPVKDDCFGKNAQKYRDGWYWAASDIYSLGLADCHLAILGQFQVWANLVVPLLKGETLWGLMCVHQCSGPRQWSPEDIEFVRQICAQFVQTWQQSEYIKALQKQSEQLTKAADRERNFIRIIDKVGQSILEKIQSSQAIESIFDKATDTIRQAMQCDRVAVYKFNPDWSGEFISESVTAGWVRLVGNETRTVWADTHLQDTQGGRYRRKESFQINDIYTTDDVSNTGFAPCHLEILEQFQIRAYIITPIFAGDELWGLLAAYQNSGPRHWEAPEVNLLNQVGKQLGIALKQASYVEAITKANQRTQAINRIVDKVRQAQDIASIFRTTTQEVQMILSCDRVAVYRFNPNWSGEFVSESVNKGWVPLVGPDIKTVWEDSHLQDTQGGRYRRNESFSVDDIYQVGHATCHLKILEQFQVRAYTIVPIFAGERLWGLLGAYQNDGPRIWHEDEINLLMQVGKQFGIAVRQAEYISDLTQSNAKEQAITRIIERSRFAQDMDSTLRTAAQEAQQVLKSDRVAIYRFNADWSGEFVADANAKGVRSLLNADFRFAVQIDTLFKQTNGGRLAKGEAITLTDVQAVNYAPCYMALLDQLQARAYLLVPIFAGDRLWGIFAAYQCFETRYWRDDETEFLFQASKQLGVALQQTEYLEQIKLATAREKTLSRIADKIRLAQDAAGIFRVATQEVRQVLMCDRIGVYRFSEDWSGEFVAEAVGTGWVPVVGPDIKTVWEDTHLQDTQGGRYRKGENFVVNDIYEVGHAGCHIEILEQFQVRAYMIVPIFSGDRLWGLLAAYQNTGARRWLNEELDLLVQVGRQFGIAIRQANTLAELQTQSQQLSALATREKTAKEQLQQSVMRVLSAVRPALQGDLTVRVPLSEDEVGTIADAYNNTLQSLRKLVTQVQNAASQVSQTSQESSMGIMGLTHQAQQELQEIQAALGQLQAMVDSTEAVANNAQQVNQAVQQANAVVQQGDQAMNRTVEGILSIRETVSETSKKIKRLSESSQKISKVVNLISTFTAQTQLLALNAAIEATRAGEAGRGFAVVADEVRALARQSAEATTEIEKLVQEIQVETNAVATAMDDGIEKVVTGTTLVSDTRQSLNAIVSATAQISGLVSEITRATQAQTQQSQTVTKTMTSVANIAQQTSLESAQISVSFQELLSTAEQLQASVDQFKVS